MTDLIPEDDAADDMPADALDAAAEQLRAVRENTHATRFTKSQRLSLGMSEPVAVRLRDASAQLDTVKQLEFAQSDSATVGVHGGFMDTMRANSVRIVGSMKFIADMCIGFSGDPFLIGYAAFSGLGRLIMMGYGTKANQQKEAEKAAGKIPAKESTLSKILHPSKYPIEAAAGSSMIGEASAGVYGVELIRDKLSPDHFKGWPIFLCELFAVYSYSNLLFSSEKKNDPNAQDQSLVFAQSQSKPVGMMGKAKQWMKDHPVVVSSVINVGIGLTMMLYSTGAWYFVGAAILLAANVLQGLLVKKRDFNVEGALEDKQAQQATPAVQKELAPQHDIPEQQAGSHAARVIETRKQRDTGDGVAMASA